MKIIRISTIFLVFSEDLICVIQEFEFAYFFLQFFDLMCS